ncbi:amidohydrolase [Steroidobacter agaridevorans]|uniref:Amidohydrolase n=1 Tax=Steroidobacter agaridevorans TaxID=2695856 RepID=A0A829Y6U9_9GAMM|nr:amidohydrolase [Steroidobacter agaridevorans]GFE78516.1 amidohydrolase [Steroidobacter agaridevorans]
MINRREMLAGMGAMLASRRLLAAERPLDVAYMNAKVWTGQRDVPLANAFGLSGNRVAVVGDNERVRKLTSRGTRIVDLKGAFVMPGFMDNHTHFLRASFGLSSPELRTAKTKQEFVDRIARSAKALRPGQWLQGGNWDEQMWGGELPSRQWIDAVTPNTPVAVVRLDQHVALLNSLALQLARIDRNTPDPEGGLIVRDEKGEPTGLIKDKAKDLLKAAIPTPSDADIDAAIGVGSAHALSKGVTQVHVTELDWVTHESLRRLRKANKIGMRFYSFVPLEDWRKLDALVEAEGRGDDWVRWGALKGLVDGSLGSRTAMFHEPYADDPSNHGIYRTPPEKLRELILGADAAGLHITVHAIGDEGNDQVLGMFEEAIAKNGARDRRFRIEHAQHLLASDVPRFAKMNIIASMQPYHAIDDGRWAIKPLGPERLHTAWAVRSLLDAKAKVTFGSDWPVAPIDPLLGIGAAVLRQTIDGANPSGWVPEQKITVQEALTAYTTTNAYAGYQEDRLGLIAPGYLADLTILDTDLTSCAPEQITRAKVLSTLVDGRLRFGTDKT